MPPLQSTAASGMFPIEQTNASAATIGPTIAFSTIRSGAHASVRKSAVEEARRQRRDVAGDQEPGDDLLPEHLQSPRKL